MTLPAIIRPPSDSEQVRASLQSRQVFNHHDAHAKEQTKLLPTQPVWVKHPQDKKWEKATIKSQAETSQSYIVQTSHGDLRRNRVHIKEAPVLSTPNKVQEQPKPVYKIILPPRVQQVPAMVPRIQNPVQNPVMKVMVQNPIQNQMAKTTVQKHIVQNPTLKTCVQNQNIKNILPKFQVQTEQSILNSTKKEIFPKESEKCVPKVIVRKESEQQGSVHKDIRVPKPPRGIGDNKTIPKVSASKPSIPSPSVQKPETLGRSS